jgi:hypothetical protein
MQSHNGTAESVVSPGREEASGEETVSLGMTSELGGAAIAGKLERSPG